MFDSMLPSGGMLISLAPPRPISNGKLVSGNYYIGSFQSWWITVRGSLAIRGQGHSLTFLSP